MITPRNTESYIYVKLPNGVSLFGFTKAVSSWQNSVEGPGGVMGSHICRPWWLSSPDDSFFVSLSLMGSGETVVIGQLLKIAHFQTGQRADGKNTWSPFHGSRREPMEERCGFTLPLGHGSSFQRPADGHVGGSGWCPYTWVQATVLSFWFPAQLELFRHLGSEQRMEDWSLSFSPSRPLSVSLTFPLCLLSQSCCF